MSFTKRYMEELEEHYAKARSIVVGAEVLMECEFHEGTFFDGGADFTLAAVL